MRHCPEVPLEFHWCQNLILKHFGSRKQKQNLMMMKRSVDPETFHGIPFPGVSKWPAGWNYLNGAMLYSIRCQGCCLVNLKSVRFEWEVASEYHQNRLPQNDEDLWNIRSAPGFWQRGKTALRSKKFSEVHGILWVLLQGQQQVPAVQKLHHIHFQNRAVQRHADCPVWKHRPWQMSLHWQYLRTPAFQVQDRHRIEVPFLHADVWEGEQEHRAGRNHRSWRWSRSLISAFPCNNQSDICALCGKDCILQ